MTSFGRSNLRAVVKVLRMFLRFGSSMGVPHNNSNPFLWSRLLTRCSCSGPGQVSMSCLCTVFVGVLYSLIGLGRLSLATSIGPSEVSTADMVNKMRGSIIVLSSDPIPHVREVKRLWNTMNCKKRNKRADPDQTNTYKCDGVCLCNSFLDGSLFRGGLFSTPHLTSHHGRDE